MFEERTLRMICATLQEAKAKLNKLVEKARKGEEVVLMRGSKHVAVIVPISEKDITLRQPMTDNQAESLWATIANERQSGKAKMFRSPEAAARSLKR